MARAACDYCRFPRPSFRWEMKPEVIYGTRWQLASEKLSAATHQIATYKSYDRRTCTADLLKCEITSSGRMMAVSVNSALSDKRPQTSCAN